MSVKREWSKLKKKEAPPQKKKQKQKKQPDIFFSLGSSLVTARIRPLNNLMFAAAHIFWTFQIEMTAAASRGGYQECWA